MANVGPALAAVPRWPEITGAVRRERRPYYYDFAIKRCPLAWGNANLPLVPYSFLGYAFSALC